MCAYGVRNVSPVLFKVTVTMYRSTNNAAVLVLLTKVLTNPLHRERCFELS